MIIKSFLDTFLNESELHILYSVKWFQEFLSHTNISIYNKSFICTQLNGFKHCLATITMLHQTFVCSQ